MIHLLPQMPQGNQRTLGNLFIFENRILSLDSMRCFQNCLDYFHLENLDELISRSLALQRPRKRSKVDPDRAAYSTLLDHTISELQKFRKQAENSHKKLSPALIDLQLITPISNELIELSRRECSEKASLFQIVSTFYRQALIIMDISCQETIKKSLLEYFQNLEANRKQAQCTINALKNQLQQIKQENDEKWKTFYMIVKDNRVLRRQKGKLMRSLEEQKQKLCNVHEELTEIAKQNEKNKLLVNYASNPESLAQFLKNSQAIQKLDHYMKNYPKQTKKVLNMDLKKLQISENVSLDEKIKYIIKAAKQSQQMFDQYEDLIDTNQRPNKLIFNISTQTDPFDIGLDPSNFKVEQLKPLKKIGRNVQIQTHRQHLKFDNAVIMLSQLICAMPQSKITRRRKALKTNAVQDLKLIDAVKHFKENMICRRVFNVKILSKDPFIKPLNFQNNIFNIAVQNETEISDFPILFTNHRLTTDIKRTKELIRKDQERRSSKRSSTQRSSLDVKIAVFNEDHGRFDVGKLKLNENSHVYTEQIKSTTPHQQQKIDESHKNTPQFTGTKPIKGLIKKSEQKYIINPSQTIKSSKKLMQVAKSFEKRRQTVNNSTLQSIKVNNTTIESENHLKTAKSKKSLKDIINKVYKRQNNQNQPLQAVKSLTYSQTISQNNRLEISTDVNKKQIRKSGFASYKKSNTVPDGLVIQELSSHESAKKTPRQAKQQIQLKKQDTLCNPITIQNVESIRKLSNQKNSPSHFKKSIIRIKAINIFSYEHSKLVYKVYRHIFNKRKEISESSQTFETFLSSFIKTQYGSGQKVVINTHFPMSKLQKCDPLLAIFDVLLDKSLSADYLQHLFKIFARLLIITGFQHMTLPYERGLKIEEEFLRMHFSESKMKQIYEKNSVFYQTSTINICQSFLNLEYSLRQQLQNTQVKKFLKRLLPSSQQSLNYEQLKELFALFMFEEKHHKHLLTLKQYCNPQIHIQSLCFYAIRQQWMPLYNIQDYISEHYNKKCIIKQGLDEGQQRVFNQKYQWVHSLIKQKQNNCNNQTLILRKCLSVMQMNYLIDKNTSISRYLMDIHDQFSLLSLKKSLKAINLY